MENWKTIPGWENYEASDLGNVRNVVTGRVLKLNKLNHRGYYQVGLSQKSKKRTYLVQQVIAMTFLGHVPNGLKTTVDHINGCKTDNRPENLELVTNRENVTRGISKRNTSSQFPGVCWFKPTKKWMAKIQINGKNKHLGYFSSELEAAQAYQDALKKLQE